ncbi:tRNA (adenosine(37)-N6)-dimethylallyltransferase MiaA [Virgibacillus sp. W0181]|uniref:tRNA (adenosine(37)-N6)-dimethylallyltransferase MiaA n=1 Tax=Virgibacillus sp. W0181 TaxID=3391581 RepID=UPI003F44F5C7
MKKTVVAIVGPTAVGKTTLSIEMAKAFNGEVINGDAMQVYKGMDVGTAKITSEEMKGINHYMLDIIPPDEDFTAADFQYNVEKYVNSITAKSKLPIIVGGSGLYIQAAIYGYSFSNHKRNPDYTAELERLVNEKGAEYLHNELKRIDPHQAHKIHPNNYRRVIRALEIYETTGTPMSDHHKHENKEPLYNIFFIGLEMERSILYNQINKRCDQMIANGLIDEVKLLYDKGYEKSTAMKAIGYKEFLSYIKGEQSMEDSIELFKRNSRRYAKRQYTWFKNKMNIQWYPITPDNASESFRTILNDLAGVVGVK